MKKLLYSLFSLLLLGACSDVLARHVCCIDTGDNVQCTAGFETKKECNAVCPNICEHIADTDPGETTGGVRN